MHIDIVYSPRERFWLWVVAAVGFLVVNVTFMYGLFCRPGALADAFTNPISVAFIADAALVLVALAYLLRRWGVARLSWGWFVALSLLAGIAFALPVVILWRGRRADGLH